MAVDDALAERAPLVRAAVLQREHAAVAGAEDSHIAGGRRHAARAADRVIQVDDFAPATRPAAAVEGAASRRFEPMTS